jgi:hypothetical protein
MIKFLRLYFALPGSPVRMAETQANEARLLALHHRAQAEYELALAAMYEAQSARLDRELSRVQPAIDTQPRQLRQA